MIKGEQREIIIKFAVAILSVIVIFVCYSYILPRTEIEMDTVYHSSYSGLFIQSKISNTGTKEITDLKVKSSIWNGTEMLGTETHYPGILNTKQSVKIPYLVFDGPHADEYNLVIIVEFKEHEEKQTLIYSYKIADYGNLAWHERYFNF